MTKLAFELSKNGFMGVRARDQTLFTWTPQDQAVLHALPQMATEPPHLDEILELAAVLDRRLLQEFTRLREQARERNVALRSGLFANCYVWASNAPAAASVFASIHNGGVFGTRSSALAAMIRARLAYENPSPGQLYLLLSLYQSVGLNEASLAPILPELLRNHWRGAAYHLRLDLMHAAHNCAWKATDQERREVVRAIEELPQPQDVGVSSIVVDALKALGALDDSENQHVEIVRSNIRDALASPHNDVMQRLAHDIWYGQFDHPYDGAYRQAFAELAPPERKALLVMAAQGADQHSSFIGVLIQELAVFGDPNLGSLILTWTVLPPTRCATPQEAIGTFAVAHIALGRLGCALPAAQDGRTDQAQTLIASARFSIGLIARTRPSHNDARSVRHPLWSYCATIPG
jgi:hypothetical protein